MTCIPGAILNPHTSSASFATRMEIPGSGRIHAHCLLDDHARVGEIREILGRRNPSVKDGIQLFMELRLFHRMLRQ